MPQDELFNPFRDRTFQAKGPSKRAVVLSRVGIGFFWLLVLALVAARAVYPI
jgi:hypothetical protein